MSSTWKSYAEASVPQGMLLLHIYSQTQSGRHAAVDMVTQIDSMGVTVSTDVDAPEHSRLPDPLRIPWDMAEAAYEALDRIFGKHHNQDTLEMALRTEQRRVDRVIDAFVQSQTTTLGMPQMAFSEGPIL